MMSAMLTPPPMFGALRRRRKKSEGSGLFLLHHAAVTSTETAPATEYGHMRADKSRQLFLRSYHFSRKKTALEKIQHSAARLRRLAWVRLRTARRLPVLLWYRLRSSAWRMRRRVRRRIKLLFRFRFHPLLVCSDCDGYTPAAWRS